MCRITARRKQLPENNWATLCRAADGARHRVSYLQIDAWLLLYVMVTRYKIGRVSASCSWGAQYTETCMLLTLQGWTWQSRLTFGFKLHSIQCTYGGTLQEIICAIWCMQIAQFVYLVPDDHYGVYI
jgi:hypothetical protein